jgi:hypothetical protein
VSFGPDEDGAACGYLNDKDAVTLRDAFDRGVWTIDQYDYPYPILNETFYS